MTCLEEIQFQCWICPKCHDDHLKTDPCTPKNDMMFMPAEDDKSYIAEEYRKRVAEIERLKEALETYAQKYGREAIKHDQLRTRLEDAEDAMRGFTQYCIKPECKCWACSYFTKHGKGGA